MGWSTWCVSTGELQKSGGLPVPYVRIMEHTAGARAPQNWDTSVMDVNSEAAWATAAPATSNMCAQASETN